MKLVKPEIKPQKEPFGIDAVASSAESDLLNHVCKQKLTPTNPMINLMVLSSIIDAVNQPKKTPATPAGIKIFKLIRL